MKNLVTGATGLVGTHILVDLLIKGEYVRATKTSNSNLGLVKNILKHYGIEKHFEEVHCVFHLAALADIVPSIENPVDYYNSNVTGTFNVLQACRKFKSSCDI